MLGREGKRGPAGHDGDGLPAAVECAVQRGGLDALGEPTKHSDPGKRKLATKQEGGVAPIVSGATRADDGNDGRRKQGGKPSGFGPGEVKRGSGDGRSSRAWQERSCGQTPSALSSAPDAGPGHE